jgi:fructose-1,6-bisphosphatase II / sedoheptulose-1,7-bisphosphatase
MDIDKKFLDQFIKTTERAAYGAFLHKGKGDKIAADQASVDEMRKQLNLIEMRGKIVIGEGELDEAPMLYVNEKVGLNKGISLDIAVDPLEGTNFAAKNLPNALSVLAVTTKGNLLNAPDMYMNKIAIGANLPKNLVDLDYSVEENIKLLAKAKSITPDKLTACVMQRERHKNIINSLNSMGVKINFITDGDVSGVISVGDPDKNIDIFFGIGGAPEGVLAAAALSCMDCQMQARLVFDDKEQELKAKMLGLKDLNKKYYLNDIVNGDVIFCATGVTDGDFVNGIKDLGDYFQAETLVMHKSMKINKVLKNKIKK